MAPFYRQKNGGPKRSTSWRMSQTECSGVRLQSLCLKMDIGEPDLLRKNIHFSPRFTEGLVEEGVRPAGSMRVQVQNQLCLGLNPSSMGGFPVVQPSWFILYMGTAVLAPLPQVC